VFFTSLIKSIPGQSNFVSINSYFFLIPIGQFLYRSPEIVAVIIAGIMNSSKLLYVLTVGFLFLTLSLCLNIGGASERGGEGTVKAGVIYLSGIVVNSSIPGGN
jgi:hypothetical protein